MSGPSNGVSYPEQCYVKGLASFDEGQKGTQFGWIQGHVVSRLFMAGAACGYGALTFSHLAGTLMKVLQCAQQRFQGDSKKNLSIAWERSLGEVANMVIAMTGILDPRLARMARDRIGTGIGQTAGV